MRRIRHSGNDAAERAGLTELLHQASREGGDDRLNRCLRLLRRDAELLREIVDRLSILGVLNDVTEIEHSHPSHTRADALWPGSRACRMKRSALRLLPMVINLCAISPADGSCSSSDLPARAGALSIAEHLATL